MARQIGRYQLLGEIGRGGMASVYEGYDTKFDRAVAIKILTRQFLHDPTFISRFERETKTVAALEHPGVVPVYDAGEQDEQPYLVMRYMRGGSLESRIAKGPMQLAEVQRVLERVSDALDFAHNKGIIHRDLKPSNILFDENGEPCITDFGIAKVVSNQNTAITKDVVVGTPSYMSPEQAKGELVDGRSDIYSLGVILFEMLTGKAPYQAESPTGVMMKHIIDPVPKLAITKLNLPVGLQTVIDIAMSKYPADRFKTGKAFVAAVQHAIKGQPVRLPKLEDEKTIVVNTDTQPFYEYGQMRSRPQFLGIGKPPDADISPNLNANAPAPAPLAPAKGQSKGLLISVVAIGLIVAAIGIYFAVSGLSKSAVLPSQTVITIPTLALPTLTPSGPSDQGVTAPVINNPTVTLVVIPTTPMLVSPSPTPTLSSPTPIKPSLTPLLPSPAALLASATPVLPNATALPPSPTSFVTPTLTQVVLTATLTLSSTIAISTVTPVAAIDTIVTAPSGNPNHPCSLTAAMKFSNLCVLAPYPVPPGGTAKVVWRIASTFVFGEFDNGSGQGFRGPILQEFAVEIGNITKNRIIKLRWQDKDGKAYQDVMEINVAK